MSDDAIYACAVWLEDHYVDAPPKRTPTGETALLECALAEFRRRGVCPNRLTDVLAGRLPRDYAPKANRGNVVGRGRPDGPERLRALLVRLRKARLGKAWCGDGPSRGNHPSPLPKILTRVIPDRTAGRRGYGS